MEQETLPKGRGRRLLERVLLAVSLAIMLVFLVEAALALRAILSDSDAPDAAVAGDVRRLAVLLADDPTLVNAQFGGNPLLVSAVNRRGRKAVELLLDRGADPNARRLGGGTALHMAAALAVPDIAELLISRGADPNASDYNGDTPLHNTSGVPHVPWEGRLAVMQVLIEAGADVNADNRYGETPMYHAAGDWRSNTPQAIALLASAGAKVDAQDWRGRTPLHFAAAEGNSGAAQSLLQLGADPNAVDRDGESVLDLAREDRLSLFLQQHGAK